MSEKFPTDKQEAYDESGHVKDVDVAHEMAKAEDPFHKKTLGIFSPSQEKIRKGEQEAEERLESLLQENINNERADIEIAALLPRFQKMREVVLEGSPGYARFRQQKWDKIDLYVKDKDRFKSRQVILGILVREIEMHEDGLKRDLERRTTDEFMRSRLGDKEIGH